MKTIFVPNDGLEIETYQGRKDIQGIHHLARYHWVKDVVIGANSARVLDAGCGCGYGSYLIAAHNPETTVIGVDNNRNAIEYAKENYVLPNLKFFTGDLCSWQYEEKDGTLQSLGSFDFICAFDSLAYIMVGDIFLLRVVDNLEKNGLYVISTPCSRYRSTISRHANGISVDYGYNDISRLLKVFFKSVLTVADPQFPNATYWSNLNENSTVYDTKNNPIVCQYHR